jgi:hypothetical protein
MGNTRDKECEMSDEKLLVGSRQRSMTSAGMKISSLQQQSAKLNKMLDTQSKSSYYSQNLSSTVA